MIRINVGNFSSKLPGCKLSIANSKPPGVKMRTLKSVFPTLAAFLVPSWGLVQGFKDKTVSWAAYTKIYQERLSSLDLSRAMKKLCTLVGSDELVLCCWEGADDEHCHRKLLYDMLPDDMKGVRE